MGYLNEQKILMTKRVEQILKDNLPMDRDKAVSLIIYEMGFKRGSAKEYLKVLFDIGKIIYDEDGLLAWNNKK